MTTVFIPNLHWWNKKTSRWVKWKSKIFAFGTIYRYGHEGNYTYDVLANHNYLFWKRDPRGVWIKASSLKGRQDRG